MAQSAEYIQQILQKARQARESKTQLRREEIAQNAALNKAFLGIMNQLVHVISEKKK